MTSSEEGPEPGASQARPEQADTSVSERDGADPQQPDGIRPGPDPAPAPSAATAERQGDEQYPAEGPAEDGHADLLEPPSSPAGPRTSVPGNQRTPDREVDWEEDWQASWQASAKVREQGLVGKRSAIGLGRGHAVYAENAYFGDDGDAETIEPLSFVPLTEKAVISQLDVHRMVTGHEEMHRRLGAHRLVVLAGQPASGRRSTAVALLAAYCPNHAISVVRSDGDLVRNLRKQSAEKLRRGAGYVVYVGSEQITPQMLESLLAMVEDRAFLVLVGEPELLNIDGLQPHVLHHPRPDLKAVLGAHLDDRLGTHLALCGPPTEDKCTVASITAYADWVMADQQANPILDLETSVRGVVQSATVLAELVHAGDAERAEVIGQWRFRARRTAKQILRDAGAANGPLLDPHRQAFCISYALFDGHPLADAFLAGDLLSGEILPRFERREPAPTIRVFDRDLDSLIPPRMRVWSDYAGSGRAEDVPRLAQLVEENLLYAILEVAWHDYDSLRRPLIQWLDALASQRQQRIRVRAAEIAGILLRYDFEGVYRDLVGSWAKSRLSSRRQCAALAFEMASLEGPAVKRIHRQVRDLAESPGFEFQDTAARAYGTRLGVQDVPVTLAALRALAAGPVLSSSGSIALSMGWLCLAGFPDPVIEELNHWISSGKEYLSRHAARTLLIVARINREAERSGRPILADLAVDSAEHRELLVKLWRGALAAPEVSARAWGVLRRWLLGAEHHEDIARLLEQLAPVIFSGALLSRAGFNLDLWRRRHPDSSVIRRIRRSLAVDSETTRFQEGK